MSEVIFRDEVTGLEVNTYAGPARTDGMTRMRLQITTKAGQWIQLSIDEWWALFRAAHTEGKHLPGRMTCCLKEHS